MLHHAIGAAEDCALNHNEVRDYFGGGPRAAHGARFPLVWANGICGVQQTTLGVS